MESLVTTKCQIWQEEDVKQLQSHIVVWTSLGCSELERESSVLSNSMPYSFVLQVGQYILR